MRHIIIPALHTETQYERVVHFCVSSRLIYANLYMMQTKDNEWLSYHSKALTYYNNM